MAKTSKATPTPLTKTKAFRGIDVNLVQRFSDACRLMNESEGSVISKAMETSIKILRASYAEKLRHERVATGTVLRELQGDPSGVPLVQPPPVPIYKQMVSSGDDMWGPPPLVSNPAPQEPSAPPAPPVSPTDEFFSGMDTFLTKPKKPVDIYEGCETQDQRDIIDRLRAEMYSKQPDSPCDALPEPPAPKPILADEPPEPQTPRTEWERYQLTDAYARESVVLDATVGNATEESRQIRIKHGHMMRAHEKELGL